VKNLPHKATGYSAILIVYVPFMGEYSGKGSVWRLLCFTFWPIYVSLAYEWD